MQLSKYTLALLILLFSFISLKSQPPKSNEAGPRDDVF